MIDRDTLLREIGLTPTWRLRAPLADAAVNTAAPAAPAAPAVVIAPPVASPAEPDTAAPMAARTQEHVATMPAAAEAPAHGATALMQAATAAVITGSAQPADTLDWAGLERAVAGCRACGLCEQRKQAVLGVGDRRADWLFVGEAPGADEDERGEPFVGQAGKLLDNMLAAIDLRRGDNLYIANTVKCRPPGNRTPTPEETAACYPFLRRQISLLQPRLIVALGRPAAQVLLGGEVKIAAARGRLHRHAGLPVIVTYHPAYLLRNLPDKAKAWEDLLFMQQTLRELEQP